ncbi:dethiobiotin synthase [Helicobacter saguini]|uniref:dethiobiotin synthase n=1 Tax=Helicobacter saguini TaxID=1548018 RepID=UPI001EE83A89|nr:ATP-dependent dethiobiotin synthetase BioD [Helicobacter saguini]
MNLDSKILQDSKDSKILHNIESNLDSKNPNFNKTKIQNLDSKNSNISNLNDKKIHINSNFKPKKLQNIESNIFPNGITLKTAASPHIAKMRENIEYNGLKLKIPESKNLVIELAGGLFSPLDSKKCMIDFISQNRCDVILVGGYYLGSINHILLSYESLKVRKIKILKIVMFGDKNKEIDNFIESYSNIETLNLAYFTKQNFKEKTQDFKKQLNNIFCYN